MKYTAFSDKPKKSRRWLLLSLLGILFGVIPVGMAKNLPPVKPSDPVFPLYPAIINNVRFWENIYEKYANNHLVIHDTRDLRRIYAVIALPSQQKRKETALYEKNIINTYKKILINLTKRPPQTAIQKRISAMFSGENRNAQILKAAEQLRGQNGLQQRFRQSVIRSGAYINEFKKIFRSYNLPEDLAYLPHVESSFHHHAYSKAGASGIWQFTKNTGGRYLIIDAAVDQRLDPFIATHAAAKYFRRSYAHLKSWPLTITSYNYGLPGTIRAQKQFHSYPGVFYNHQTTAFKFAARNFYSEFLAARNVAQKLEKILPLQKPEALYSMRLKGYLKISDIRHYFRISSAELKRLNPALRSTVFTGSKRVSKG